MDEPAPNPAPRGAHRRLFVGDVQGCREELERLLEDFRFDPARDVLRPVGDLVNRGPDNVGTLRLARSLGARPVLGNHDLHCLGVAAGTRGLRADDTLADLLAAEDRGPLLAWLAEQPLLRVDDDLFQVHAGLDPRWRDPARALLERPTEEARRFATRVRRCDADGRLDEDVEPRPGPQDPRFRPWFDFYRPERHGGRRVVFGHWAVRGLVREPHVIGLDTGCVWGGALSGWCPEEDRLLSVPARRRYQRPGR